MLSFQVRIQFVILTNLPMKSADYIKEVIFGEQTLIHRLRYSEQYLVQYY